MTCLSPLLSICPCAVLLQLLRAGGPELLDDLSLAKQCKIGENILTSGHHLPAKSKYCQLRVSLNRR